MNIKSLLFGSAAALVAVSGARAADAVVVAEPEPAEYVKICDVYGAGYFYIPGTETCMRISGYVRYTASVGSEFSGYDGKWNLDKLDASRGVFNDQGTWSKETKIVLNVDTGQETEYGTLSTHAGIKANWGTDVDGAGFSGNTGAAALDSAYIKLGGLMIGYADSIFADWTGYAGAAINNSFIQYGDDHNTNQISYTFDAGNGFSAILGFEQGQHDSDVIDSYVPHVVGGAKFTQGWGGISAVAAYNSVWEEWAAKARLDVNVNEQFSLFVMGGYGTDDNVSRNDYKPWGGNWAVWGGGSFKANEKATIYAEASYDENKDIAASLGVAYSLVPGFIIKPEVNYTKYGNVAENGALAGEDGWGGVIRFQRNF
ncbi:porin [Mesorhizobium sp. 8]|uniref:porin n=1 Tax=Mesorhizobium sp. 8 TaxID=2584466 RepID=UPI00111DDE40|nr:porin [Mesorhizobium sp. 8]QDB98930.1 porin [Mesorhizobium sp. 8]